MGDINITAGFFRDRSVYERRTGLAKTMTKVEAVIQNSKLETVKSALHEIGVEGMTVLQCAVSSPGLTPPFSPENDLNPSFRRTSLFP